MVTSTEIASFPNLKTNVSAYITNLNRHAAYKDFRLKRAFLRKKISAASKISPPTLSK